MRMFTRLAYFQTETVGKINGINPLEGSIFKLICMLKYELFFSHSKIDYILLSLQIY